MINIRCMYLFSNRCKINIVYFDLKKQKQKHVLTVTCPACSGHSCESCTTTVIPRGTVCTFCVILQTQRHTEGSYRTTGTSDTSRLAVFPGRADVTGNGIYWCRVVSSMHAVVPRGTGTRLHDVSYKVTSKYSVTKHIKTFLLLKQYFLFSLLKFHYWN